MQQEQSHDSSLEIERLLAAIEATDPDGPDQPVAAPQLFRRLYRFIAPDGRLQPWAYCGALLSRIRDLLGQHGRSHLELTILILEACLHEQVCSDDVARLGAVHQLLADAYYDRFGLTGDRSVDGEQAFLHYNAALEHFGSVENVAATVGVRRSLGRLHRAQENFRAAADNFRAALAARTEQVPRTEWTALKGELALTLIGFRQPDAYEEAISHLNEAWAETSETETPELSAKLHECLGMVYCNRVYGGDVSNRDAASRHFLAALRIFTETGNQLSCAVAKSELGGLLLRRTRAREGDFSEKAIEYLESAQQYFSENTNPCEWANLERDIASALTYAGPGSDLQDKKRASRHFRNALRVYEAFGKTSAARITRELLRINEEILQLDDKTAGAIEPWQRRPPDEH